jgi:hypothetical protein
MGTPPVPKKKAAAFIKTMHALLRDGYVPRGIRPPYGRSSAASEAAARFGLTNGNLAGLIARMEFSSGMKVDWSLYNPTKAAPAAKIAPAPKAPKPPASDEEVRAALLKRPMPVADLAERLGLPLDQAGKWVEAQQRAGHNIALAGNKLRIERTHQTAIVKGREPLVIESDNQNRFVVGLTGDNHLGSKYARLDVLGELYDRFAAEGVRTVLNTGNWIEGEARFNVHDLLPEAHGFDAQLRYLAEHYPRRKGIATHAVWGDDHEGWYGQKFGVDVGRRGEQVMRETGRKDWHDLGFMEANVILRNRNTGAEAAMLVVHPGGGSAYATSYTMQKLVESLDGGEKPAVLAAGHYHKLEVLNVRNVWCIQTGTTQDQTPFMRKKKLEAHVGGVVLRLEQDPQTGAIIECNGQRRYFVRGYYNGRWSHSGAVTQARRAVA